LRLGVEFRQQGAGSKKIRPVVKTGLMVKKDLKIPLAQLLYRAVLAEHPQRARPERQQQQRAGDHRCGLGNWSGGVLPVG
jgi:hypothetical protein